MTLRIRRPLRLPVVDQLTEPWPELVEQQQQLQAHLIARGWDPERAEEKSRRLVFHPVTCMTYSGSGATREQLPGGAA